MALAHERLDAVVTAVHENAVRYAYIAFHIHVQGIFITIGESHLGAVGRAFGLNEAAGKHALVGGTGNLVVDIGDAVEIVLAEIKNKAVDYDVAQRALVIKGPACIDVEERSDELLVIGLDLSDMLYDVTLAEVGRVSAVETQELTLVRGGIAELSDLDVTAIHIAKVITFCNQDYVVVFCSIDRFLKVLHCILGRESVGAGRTGGDTYIVSLASLGSRSVLCFSCFVLGGLLGVFDSFLLALVDLVAHSAGGLVLKGAQESVRLGARRLNCDHRKEGRKNQR